MAAKTKTPRRKTAAKKAKKAPVAIKKAPAARKKAPVKAKSAARKTARATGTAKAAGKRESAGPRTEPPMLEALRAEHRHIASMMQLCRDQLDALERGQRVDPHVLYEIMDYMVRWPDRYHHPREDLVYGRAAELDPVLGDNVDSLQRDHDQTAKNGRELLRKIERWREGEVPGSAIVSAGRAYVTHMYEHMNSEEKLVFPEIARTLNELDWRDLEDDDLMRPVADPLFGPRVQREFRNLSRRLRSNVRRGVERGVVTEWVGIEAVMESLEVLNAALESLRGVTREHLRTALEDSRRLFGESPLTAPARCAANNARLGRRLLKEVAGISRDAFEDLTRVNRDRRERLSLVEGPDRV